MAENTIMDSEILLFIIKLILGGVISFLSIILMSKTRDLASMAFVTGFLLSYATIVYQLLIKLGVLGVSHIMIFGVPLTSFLCVALPSICFIIALILMIIKERFN